MNRFRRLIAQISEYRKLVVLSLTSNVLMVFFTIFSIPALIPLVEILLNQNSAITVQPEFSWSVDGVYNFLNYRLGLIIESHGRSRALIYLCVGIVSIFLLKNIFKYLGMYFIAPVRNGIVHDLRTRLHDKYLSLPMNVLSDSKKGDLVSRASSDVQEVEWSILKFIESLVVQPLMIIGALFFMIWISPSLTLYVLLLLLFTGIIIGGIGSKLKSKSHIAQTKLGSVLSQVDETLTGMRILRAFNAQDSKHKKFVSESAGYRDVLTQLLRRRDLSSPLSEFLGIIVVSVLIYLGFHFVDSGQINTATFLIFLYAFYSVISPAKSFSDAYYNVQKGMAALDRIYDILESDSEVKYASQSVAPTVINEGLYFRNLWFKYTDDQPYVIQNFNLEIPKNASIALVGSSGSGKSTLTDLLLKFYTPVKGSILLNQSDIQTMATESYRKLFALVTQNPILFNASIAENIACGDEPIQMDKIMEACDAALVTEFLEEDGKDFSTKIGDYGHKLSGGQRQRIAIARAIYKKAPIIILDEATSSLDSESELKVQEALVNLLKNKTSIIIAHRLSTVKNADNIVVLKNGRIIEQGKHGDLLKLQGEYFKFVNLQNIEI
jgi:subfamily B ATP-binding cassette protein MsbA